MKKLKSFRIIADKGFQITFKNGITLSTFFGLLHYCENNFLSKNKSVFETLKHNEVLESKDCEVAVIKNKKFITRKMYKEVFGEDCLDDVVGYVKIDDWIKIFEWCKNQK